MFNRIRQFKNTLFAEFNETDKKFIDTILNNKEKQLFYAMNIADRQHCLKVAKTALQISNTKLIICNEMNLIKASLLHDCGKVCGDINLVFKCLIVILDKIFGYKLLKLLMKKSQVKNSRGIKHAIYIYYNHPEIGANKLLSLNTPKEVVNAVNYHHHKKNIHRSNMEKLLIESDNLN